MTSRSISAKPAKANSSRFSFPVELGWIVKQRPTVHGESDAEYDALLAHLSEAIEPDDVVELLWVKDLADVTWESLRLRRLRRELIQYCRDKAIRDKIDELTGTDEPINKKEVAAWSDEAAVTSLEPVSRMIEWLDDQRNTILREIERRRDRLAQRLRIMSDHLLRQIQAARKRHALLQPNDLPKTASRQSQERGL
jgi:hypothetical protein